MAAVKIIVIWGCVAIFCAAAAGIVAEYKNRKYSWWSAWSFIFPPMLIVLLLLPSHKGERARSATLDEEDNATP